MSLSSAGDRHRGRLPLLALPATRSAGRPPAKELVVTLKRAASGWIEGQAVDADTGEPVRLDKDRGLDFEPSPERRGRPAGASGATSNSRSPAGSRRSSPPRTSST